MKSSKKIGVASMGRTAWVGLDTRDSIPRVSVEIHLTLHQTANGQTRFFSLRFRHLTWRLLHSHYAQSLRCLGALPSSNPSPSVSSLFCEPCRHGDSAAPENLPRLDACESQDIALSVPISVSLKNIQPRKANGKEVNEVAVEDHRPNPGEKFAT